MRSRNKRVSKETAGKVVNIHNAKTELSQLIAGVLVGEEVIIARAGKPVAKLVPYDERKRMRKPGSARGEVWISPDFDTSLPEEVLKDFEG